jgi:hypothetical protein
MTFRFKFGNEKAIIKPPKLTDLDYSKPIIGKDWSTTKNCLSCSLFSSCKEQGKGYKYVCNSYNTQKLAEFNVDSPQFNVDNLEFTQSLQSNININLPNKINRDGSIELDDIEDINETELNKILDKIVMEFGSGLPKDFRIDDSDIPLAKNYYDWCYNKRFAGDDPTFPFPKQVEIISNYLSEICPVCSDREYSKNIPVDAEIDGILERIQFLNNGKCPKCHKTRLDFWNDPDLKYKRYTELMGVAGQRSSKTSTINRLHGYQLHRLFKTNRIHKVFGIEPSKFIESSFTATTFAKAKTNLYDPLVNSFKNYPWYVEYNKMLDYYGQKYGQELYKILNHSTLYRTGNHLIYAQSPDPQNMRGADRILSAIDEVSHLYAKAKDAIKLNPGEVYNSLRNSQTTFRMSYIDVLKQGHYDVPSPLMSNISSPRSINDMGMKLLKRSYHPDSRIYSFHYTIFEMNPLATKDDDMIEELRGMERDDPALFRRDFLAIPPNASNAFITDKNVVRACVRKDHVNAITCKTINCTGQTKKIKMLTGEILIKKNKNNINFTTPKIMSLDAGISDNSFAICVMHLEKVEKLDERGLPTGDSKYIKVVDILAEIIPRDERIISFPAVYDDVISPIIEEFNVMFVCADRWNSIETLQNSEIHYGLSWAQKTLKFPDFRQFRNGLYSGDVILPMPEMKIDDAFVLATTNYPYCFEGNPVAHTQLQILTVENLMDKAIIKGQGYTDDLFRALVVGYTMTLDEEIQEILLSPPSERNSAENMAAVYGSLGSGGLVNIAGGNIGTMGGGNNSNIIPGVGAIGSYQGYGSSNR